MKAWRRLQQLGAVAVKNAVYVLPYSAQALEDFTWLREDVKADGGQATVFAASSVADVEDAAIVEQFQAARTLEYEAVRAALRPFRQARKGNVTARPDLKAVRAVRDQFEQVRSRDFFGAPLGHELDAALTTLERAVRPSHTARHARTAGTVDPASYKGRTWVTRPRPGVDRFACAWLIRTFIDPGARFVFAERAADRDDAVAFDMYDGGFQHRDGRCSFEVLQTTFGIADPVVTRLSELVHDIDLKDNRYRAPEAPAVELLIDGYRRSTADDHELLTRGITLFEALYEGYAGRSARLQKTRRTR